MSRTIVVQTGERMILHDNGDVERPSCPPPYNKPSGKWKITGAVTKDNLGHVRRRYTLAEILANPTAFPWQHKNGAQQTFLTDVDHGTARTWGSPSHHVE